MNVGDRCPVCRWPGQADGQCQRCGWTPTPGSEADTATDSPDPAARIAISQRDYDIRAAARVAGAMPLEDQNLVLSWLATFLRGGPIEPGHIGEELRRSGAGPLATAGRGMGFALTRLVSRRTDALAFVELGPDVVSTQVLGVDKCGVPETLAAEIHPWTMILPRLQGPNALRYLRMAGGVGIAPLEADESEPKALIAELTENLGPVLEQFKAAAREKAGRIDVVVVHRTRMWSLLDEAAALAWAILRPVTEISVRPESGTLSDVLHAIAARAPLRYSYDLVLVDVKKRQVRPSPYELFPAGSVALPGRYRMKSVSVSAISDHAAPALLLPIVARRSPQASWHDAGALTEQRPVISMATLDAAGRGPFQVRVQLVRPGVTEFLGPPEVSPADETELGGRPKAMGDMPEQLWRSQGNLDLVLLVEMAGTPKDVAARIRLAKDVVSEFEPVPEVRIAVLGYRDHFRSYKWNLDVIRDSAQESKALIVGSVHGFADQAKLGTSFWRSERWNAVDVGDDGGAPVEDALWLIANPDWNWRPDAQHVVIIVGRKPPHSDRSEDHVALACESHCPDWRQTLKELRRNQGLKCLVVLDDEPASDYALKAWETLAAPGTIRRWRHNTRLVGELARDCGMTSAQLRFATLARAAAGQEGAA